MNVCTSHHIASATVASTACKAARFQLSTPGHQHASFQLPFPTCPVLPTLPVLFSTPSFSVLLGTPCLTHGSWQQLLDNDNQMSLSCSPFEQPEPGVCLSALQRATGSGSAQLHGANSSQNPHSEPFIHEIQGSRPSAGLCPSRDTRLLAVFGWLWQQCPAESAVGSRAGTVRAGKNLCSLARN